MAEITEWKRAFMAEAVGDFFTLSRKAFGTFVKNSSIFNFAQRLMFCRNAVSPRTYNDGKNWH
jgi:hypothetical protein